MGAETFYVESSNPHRETSQTAAQEAFLREVTQARYEYGSGGYTGTMAEKSSFVLVTLPEGITPPELYDAMLSANDEPKPRQRWTREATVRIKMSCDRPSDSPPQWTPIKQNQMLPMSNHFVAEVLDDGLWQPDGEITVSEPAQQRWNNVLKVRQAMPNFDDLHRCFDDKWGPCLAVSHEDRWVFMGWASS